MMCYNEMKMSDRNRKNDFEIFFDRKIFFFYLNAQTPGLAVGSIPILMMPICMLSGLPCIPDVDINYEVFLLLHASRI